MRFSQRIGKKPIKKDFQINEMDLDLRNGLWNAVKIFIIESVLPNKYEYSKEFDSYCKVLWIHFYKLPVDKIPHHNYDAEEVIRNYFYEFEWFEVYDFLEFNLNLNPQLRYFDNYAFSKFCNNVLEKEFSAYRIVENLFAPITNEIEIAEIGQSFELTKQFTGLKGANIHLNNALDKLSNKTNPDYRNSIKESISSVEFIARKITNKEKATLGDALKEVDKYAQIHPALIKGLRNIYGYTNDSDGIRHALTENQNCEFEDAKFMLIMCCSFVNYLIGLSNNGK